MGFETLFARRAAAGQPSPMRAQFGGSRSSFAYRPAAAARYLSMTMPANAGWPPSGSVTQSASLRLIWSWKWPDASRQDATATGSRANARSRATASGTVGRSAEAQPASSGASNYPASRSAFCCTAVIAAGPDHPAAASTTGVPSGVNLPFAVAFNPAVFRGRSVR
jgi:hypothetical protein